MKQINVHAQYRRCPTKTALSLGAASLLAVSQVCCSDDFEPFTLQLLHAADMESGIAALDDAPRFSAILDQLRAEMPTNTLVLSSGDNYILGPFFSASDDAEVEPVLGGTDPGLGDIRILNAMGFQATCFGNHEFDAGTGIVFDLIAARDSPDGGTTPGYPGVQFPYLSTNLDFTGDDELAELFTDERKPAGELPNRIARSTLIEVDGEYIGIVGATTPILDEISSPGGVGVNPADFSNGIPSDADIEALAAVIQQEVDALTAIAEYEIDKVILLAHMQQIDIETRLAGALKDVDIIVAGGSNTILADAPDRLRPGDEAVDTYPIILTSAGGEPVLVVNTDGNYRYLGRLVVEFDDTGVILNIDNAASGIFATDEDGVKAMGNPAPIADVVAITDALRKVIVRKDGNTFGKTDVYLNGERPSVRTEETNLGNLTADADLAVAREAEAEVHVAIRNGGSVRDPIGVVTYPPGSTDPAEVIRTPPPANEIADKEAGQISQLDIENALRFNNTLVVVTVTAETLKALVENGVQGVAPGATPGAFPQIAGMRFSFDPDRSPNDRVRSLLVLDPTGGDNHDIVVQDGSVQGDGTRTFRVATSAFLAGGGDGYPFPSDETAALIELSASNVDADGIDFAPPGSEQHALAKYLRNSFSDATAFTAEDTPAAMDERIQNLQVRDQDTVIPQP